MWQSSLIIHARIISPHIKINTNLRKGDVYMTVEFTQFWCGNDLKENIIMSDGEFLLTDIEMQEVANLGKTVEEAKLKLTALSKNHNFLDFCRQK